LEAGVEKILKPPNSPRSYLLLMIGEIQPAQKRLKALLDCQRHQSPNSFQSGSYFVAGLAFFEVAFGLFVILRGDVERSCLYQIGIAVPQVRKTSGKLLRAQGRAQLNVSEESKIISKTNEAISLQPVLLCQLSRSEKGLSRARKS
jgi:hypothetical protein